MGRFVFGNRTVPSNQLIRALFSPSADRRLKRLWPEDLAQQHNSSEPPMDGACLTTFSYLNLHNNPPLVPILSWNNPNHVFPNDFLKIHIDMFPIYAQAFQVAFFPQFSPPIICMLLSHPPYLLHAPFITFLFISWVILSKHHHSYSCLLCNFVQSP